MGYMGLRHFTYYHHTTNWFFFVVFGEKNEREKYGAEKLYFHIIVSR